MFCCKIEADEIVAGSRVGCKVEFHLANLEKEKERKDERARNMGGFAGPPGRAKPDWRSKKKKKSPRNNVRSFANLCPRAKPRQKVKRTSRNNSALASHYRSWLSLISDGYYYIWS